MESRSMKSEVNIMELAQSDIKARIKEGITKQEREAIDRLKFRIQLYACVDTRKKEDFLFTITSIPDSRYCIFI